MKLNFFCLQSKSHYESIRQPAGRQDSKAELGLGHGICRYPVPAEGMLSSIWGLGQNLRTFLGLLLLTVSCTYFFHKLFPHPLGTLLYELREIRHLIIVFLGRRKEHSLEFAFSHVSNTDSSFKNSPESGSLFFHQACIGHPLSAPGHKDEWDTPCVPGAPNLVGPMG